MKFNMQSFYRGISLAAVFWTTVSMSAYTPHETGSRNTASGAKAKEGYTCAANFVPIGSVIIYEGHKYVVQDRMNPTCDRHVDLFMESHKKALQFGRREAKVQVITTDDDHLKLPKEDKTKKNRNSENKQNETLNGQKQPEQSDIIKAQQDQPAQTEEMKSTEETAHSSLPHAPHAPQVLKPQARP